MHTCTRLIAFAGLACLALAGCVSFTRSISKNEEPSSSDAYLYGRFTQRGHTTAGTAGYIGLQFACKKSYELYTIAFSAEEPLQVLRLPEGDVCSLSNIVFTFGNGEMAHSNHELARKLRRPLRFDAGKAYYLGDFDGYWNYGGNEMTWELTSATDNFVNTTKDMRSLFPKMGAFTTQKMLVQQ